MIQKKLMYGSLSRFRAFSFQKSMTQKTERLTMDLEKGIFKLYLINTKQNMHTGEYYSVVKKKTDMDEP